MNATFDDTDRLTDVTGGLWGSGGLHAEYDRGTAEEAKGTGAKTLDRVKVPWAGSLSTTERTFAFTDSGRLAQVKVNGSRTIDYTWDTDGTGDLLSVADGSATTTFESVNGHVSKMTSGSDVTTYVYGDTGRRESRDDRLGNHDLWLGGRRHALDLAACRHRCRLGELHLRRRRPAHGCDRHRLEPVEPGHLGRDHLRLRLGRTRASLPHRLLSAAHARIEYLHFGEDRPFAASYSVTRGQESTSALFQLMANDHGDVVALADEAGEVFARYAYGPYGEAEGIETRATATLTAALASEIAAANDPLRGVRVR